MYFFAFWCNHGGYWCFHLADFNYALVLEPTNKRAALSAEKLRKLFQ